MLINAVLFLHLDCVRQPRRVGIGTLSFKSSGSRAKGVLSTSTVFARSLTVQASASVESW